MASIVLRNFGGMAPSANPQAISESTATWVQNLNLRFADFRPLAMPANVQAASAGQSLYRFETTGAFITRPGAVSFVRGLIPNDTTERTYYTGDGAPKVVDSTGEIRQLGVPAPTAAPTVTALKSDEFSESDAVAARDETLSRIQYAVRGALGFNAITYNVAVKSDAELASKFIVGLAGIYLSAQYIAFNIPGAMSGSGFIPTNPSHNNLNDPRLGFRLESIDGTMKAFVPLLGRMRGAVVAPNTSALLQAVTHPVTFTTFIKPELADSVTANLVERIKVPNQTRDETITKMRALLDEFVKVADSGDAGSPMSKGAVQAFYARADINNLVEAAITRAVSAAYSAMRGYAGENNTNLPVTGTP